MLGHTGGYQHQAGGCHCGFDWPSEHAHHMPCCKHSMQPSLPTPCYMRSPSDCSGSACVYTAESECVSIISRVFLGWNVSANRDQCLVRLCCTHCLFVVHCLSSKHKITLWFISAITVCPSISHNLLLQHWLLCDPM